MLDLPIEAWDYVGEVMSNFDHEIDEEVAERLRAGDCHADYPAWNFHAVVWFADNLYHARIKRYLVHIDTISCPTLREIMSEASERYGGE